MERFINYNFGIQLVPPKKKKKKDYKETEEDEKRKMEVYIGRIVMFALALVIAWLIIVAITHLGG